MRPAKAVSFVAARVVGLFVKLYLYTVFLEVYGDFPAGDSLAATLPQDGRNGVFLLSSALCAIISSARRAGLRLAHRALLTNKDLLESCPMAQLLSRSYAD